MKGRGFLCVIPLLFLLGCHTRPEHSASKLHINAVEGCDSEAVVASMADRTYRLEPIRPASALGVACYMPVGTEDVGSDLDARLDTAAGVVHVQAPRFGIEAAYTIESATERK